MADRTGIEWTDATWNPIRGCSRVSEGCRHCYAETQAARIITMDRGRGITEGEGSYDGLLAKGGQWNGTLRMVPELLGQPYRWTAPRRIFVNSMSDLFHEAVPFEYIAAVFAVMAVTTRHTYQVLTKRPQRMLEFFKWVDDFESVFPGDRVMEHWPKHLEWQPHAAGRGGYDNCGPAWPLENVWIGVSVENQAAADERVPLLLQTPAAVRWVSMEPLLGPVDLSVEYLRSKLGYYPFKLPSEHRTTLVDLLDWVVVGGESGQNARPMHPSWARVLRDQCFTSGAAFLFKQWGEWAPGENVLRQRGHVRTASLALDGQWLFSDENLSTEGGHVDDEPDLYRIGKRAAGRLLDGVQYDGYPPPF